MYTGLVHIRQVLTVERGAQYSEYIFTFSQWENCKCKESVILSDSRSSDIPGAELWVSSPPPKVD